MLLIKSVAAAMVTTPSRLAMLRRNSASQAGAWRGVPMRDPRPLADRR
ncbi:MAG: hypothetical protein J0H35_00855 [Rhodospirillales bacterium]|nr:hypothetical protein [Rhodospirillales bacterium]